MYFKLHRWSDLPIFIKDIPFMHQMMITCIGTILIIYLISYFEGNKDNPKGIKLTKQLFETSPSFNISATIILLITTFLYAIFW